MLKQRLLVSLALGVLSGTAGAAPEATYPATGTIDYLNTQHDAIVIDDTSYVLKSLVTVHGAGGNLSRGSLHKGMHVGFRTQPQGRASVITEMWILP